MHLLFIVLCIHHHKPSILPSLFITPVPSPHPPFFLVVNIQLSMSLKYFLVNPFTRSWLQYLEVSLTLGSINIPRMLLFFMIALNSLYPLLFHINFIIYLFIFQKYLVWFWFEMHRNHLSIYGKLPSKYLFLLIHEMENPSFI